ncbi:MAG TPA: tripartite tricarboxylate transporter substrate binding protein [Burkholderiales bacterium]|nr:tripartite tricarboxylate transporter substrate binding protein [Burkholderiales bacterium]
MVWSQHASAQSAYPIKPIRIIVGQAPGGATDLVARTLTGRLTEALGQPVIVDNRTGAAGSIGAGMVAKSAPDGYTLLLVSSSFAINPSLYSKLPFDPLKDLAPVILLAEAPFLLVVHPSLPTRTVADLVKLARAKPDTMNYASGGTGSSGHLAGELFKSAAGVKMVHVPHKGAGPALTDTIAGQVDLTFASIISSLQHVRSGRLRALAVTSAKRSAALPDLPTVEEAGVRPYSTTSWYAALAPAGTSAQIIGRLNSDLQKIVTHGDVRQKLSADGAEPAGGTPEDLRKHLAAEMAKWQRVVKAAHIALE